MARGGKQVTSELWARFLVEHAGIILRRILRASGIEYTEDLLLRLALQNTITPDPFRERLDDVWNA